MKQQLALWLISLCLLPSQTLSPELRSHVMIWRANGECIFYVHMGENVRIEAPMRDGKPDLSQARLLGMKVEYEPRCGRIEAR